MIEITNSWDALCNICIMIMELAIIIFAIYGFLTMPIVFLRITPRYIPSRMKATTLRPPKEDYSKR